MNNEEVLTVLLLSNLCTQGQLWGSAFTFLSQSSPPPTHCSGTVHLSSILVLVVKKCSQSASLWKRYLRGFVDQGVVGHSTGYLALVQFISSNMVAIQDQLFMMVTALALQELPSRRLMPSTTAQPP
jgi:hypothetical protein